MLEIKTLTVTYGTHLALIDITLSVQPGEILAIVGPNGAGKTTLMRVVSGTLKQKHGQVIVDGMDVTTLSPSERARYMAVVPQARQLPQNFSVWHTVLLGRTPYLNWLGQPSEADRRRTTWAMERTQIMPLAERRIDELSGGEQQRVLLARALAQDTPILLLDEPTAHLDLHHQATILSLVRELVDERQLAVLMALHDLNLVSLYADRVAVLKKGQLSSVGLPNQVLNPEHLSEVYQVPLLVVNHPDYDIPLILLDGHDPKMKERLARPSPAFELDQ
jgi:iron complex transport system ATP-binding protein